MSPRVVVNGRFLTQPLTGVQRFAHEITSRLVEMRDDVVVVAPPGPLQVPVEYDVQRIGSHGGHRWEQLELPAYLKRAGSPLLLGLGSTGPAFYANQVVTHHDITYVRHPESFSRGFRAAYRLLMPPTLRSARKIITVSEFSKREISAWYRLDPDKVVVVNNAVGPQFAPGAEEPREGFVLAASSPNAHKNFARLVEAVASMHPVPRLKIVGGQDKAFAPASLQEHPDVEWLGRVSDEGLVSLLQRASVFVFPSLYEGFGIPPLEAQACGCPVVAADIPPLREVLDGSADLVDPHDVRALARAIDAVLHDEQRARRLRDLGQQNVARFSWGRSTAAVSAIVDRCLEADGPR